MFFRRHRQERELKLPAASALREPQDRVEEIRAAAITFRC
jgi:hypothetical protein